LNGHAEAGSIPAPGLHITTATDLLLRAGSVPVIDYESTVAGSSPARSVLAPVAQLAEQSGPYKQDRSRQSAPVRAVQSASKGAGHPRRRSGKGSPSSSTGLVGRGSPSSVRLTRRDLMLATISSGVIAPKSSGNR